MMKTSYPRLAALGALFIITLLSASCRTAEARRETLGIRITPRVTHIAVGQTAQLTAFQEYRLRTGENGAASAEGPVPDVRREPVSVMWSVSDKSLVSVGEGGQLSALRPGRVTIKGVWGSYEAAQTLSVLNELEPARLPQINSSDAVCQAQSIGLRMDENKSLRFELGFDDAKCRDIKVETKAPAQPLPWQFRFDGGTLELSSARGLVVSGAARIDGKGEASFTVWSEGEGAYPVALKGKTVLLVGDSMAEGLRPSLQKMVEALGGRFYGEPWQSSTIIGWEGSGRLKEMIKLHQPDIIFISLGSNELQARRPEGRAPLIKRMLAEIGARQAFWIGPPSWKPDRGLLRVIEENFQPGHFFNANDLQLPRQADGKHPTVEGFEQWTEKIWSWYARMSI